MDLNLSEKQVKRIAKSIFDDILEYCEMNQERFENFKETMEESKNETKSN